MAGPFTFPVALAIPFEPNRNPQWGGTQGPSGIESINVQDAIEEAKADALANDRFMLLAYYGGNAGTGRYLEIFPNTASDVSPIYLSAGALLRAVTLQTSAASATCNVAFFDLNVSPTIPVYTVVMNNVKRVQYVGSPSLASFSINALLAIRVTSGSINTPTMAFTFSSTGV